MYLEVENFFDNFKADEQIIDQISEESIEVHGRKEHRKCYTFTDLAYLPDTSIWPKIKSVVCIESSRTIRGKTSFEKRYYLSSLAGNATKMLQSIKQHWTIENNLHWRLDVTFNEDKCRTKYKNCLENMNIVRKIALAILDADKRRLGGTNKRNRIGWSDKNIIEILNSFIESINTK